MRVATHYVRLNETKYIHANNTFSSQTQTDRNDNDNNLDDNNWQWCVSSVAESMVNRFNRRKSVFAESYDPEGDDDDDESHKQAVYPKSDQQRHRLAEAVKNILLFRSLDPVSRDR